MILTREMLPVILIHMPEIELHYYYLKIKELLCFCCRATILQILLHNGKYQVLGACFLAMVSHLPFSDEF